jgi:hypothetical protein
LSVEISCLVFSNDVLIYEKKNNKKNFLRFRIPRETNTKDNKKGFNLNNRQLVAAIKI